MKDFETTEVPSIEFIGYRIPQHKQNNYSVIHKASSDKSVSGNSGIKNICPVASIYATRLAYF